MLLQQAVATVLTVYVLPVQVVLGVLGNSLNLCVLLSRGMRTPTNILLATIASADIAMLLSLSVNFFKMLTLFRKWTWFRWTATWYGSNVGAVSNWLSAISIWLVLTITIERLLVIIWPLKAKYFWKSKRLPVFILLILVTSFLITFHMHLYQTPYTIVIPHTINSTTPDGETVTSIRNITRIDFHIRKDTFIHIMTLMQLILVIVIPETILIIVNSLLIYFLKRQQHMLFRAEDAAQSHRVSETQAINAERARHSQRKVTLMVVVIVTSFSITHTPSGALYFYLYMTDFSINSNSNFVIANHITNSLVATGKAINFFLFCSSSEHFRKRLWGILRQKVPALTTRLYELSPTVFKPFNSEASPAMQLRGPGGQLLYSSKRSTTDDSQRRRATTAARRSRTKSTAQTKSPMSGERMSLRRSTLDALTISHDDKQRLEVANLQAAECKRVSVSFLDEQNQNVSS